MLHGLLALATVSSVAAIGSTTNVDYVIVGGGPAGFVIAEKLSQNSNVTVTLLEAGPDGNEDPLINSMSQMQQEMPRVLLTEI